MALRFKPPEEKNESQELLRQEQSRTAPRVGRSADQPSPAAVAGAAWRGAQGRQVKIYLLKDGKAQPVEVQVGITDGSKSEVSRRRAQGKRSDHHWHVEQRASQGQAGTGQSVPAGAAAPGFPMSELIRVEDVHKTYRMGDVEVPALRGINLTIAHGEFVAVMGSSGSGKSTFMNILGCLDRPNAGKYFLEGQEVGSL